MTAIRPAAVAGQFYPDDPNALTRAVRALLDEWPTSGRPPPKAIIAPHAGYAYSGPIAAAAYARLAPARGTVRRIVLLGPSHRVYVRGLAVPTAESFATPLGVVPIDRAALSAIAELPQVEASERAHAAEHSLEVHLPFLQTVLDDFTLVPFAVGEASPEEVAEVLDLLWGGPETLIVVSSDLSHYHGYREAQDMDERTCRLIESMQGDVLAPEDACGCRPVAGLLREARYRGLTVETLDLRNSGDTSGSREQVVGYGAWALHEGGKA